MLVFEDLHWADDALLDFVEHLLEWAADVPLLVVVAARPELLDRRPGWGERANTEVLHVGPLSGDDTARLLAALLETSVLPADLQATLLTRAGGNPLYAEEYVRMLTDRGQLGRGGPGRAARVDALPLPETVQALIAAPIDALGPEEKAVLADAAVLGSVVWLGALAELGGRPREAVRRQVEVLEQREFPARRAPLGRRREDPVQLRPHRGPRRRLRPDLPGGPSRPAPPGRRVDRVPHPRPGRGPGRAARPPLVPGARVRPGGRPAAAAAHLEPTLAFYHSVGARLHTLEAEALLPPSA